MLNLKKILSAAVAASILASFAAVPAMADYNTAEYDIVEVNNTYDDGTVVNSIDNSKAFQAGDSFEKVFSTAIDSTKEFYLGFDFKFDNANASIEIPKFKSDGVNSDRVGPIITYNAEQLQTQTGGSSFQPLGKIELEKWYSAEIEGRTGIGAQYTTFRLYSYDAEGAKTLVQETTSFNMRNLSSENRSFNGMQIKNVSIDNVKLIQEKPDTITLSVTADEMDAGSNISFDYMMSREDKEFNKYPVTWSVYDENDESPLNNESIIISDGGVLAALIDVEDQFVTVRASAEFGGKTLYGSKKIKIKAVDTSAEKFDTVTVLGPAEVKAGTTAEYTFTATKAGEDVTDTLEASDIEWSIYNGIGIMKNNNKNIKIENGKLKIDDSVIPQSITVRASSKSGTVFGAIPVEIKWSDNQKETVLSYNACEQEITNTVLVDSWDGSKAYQTSDNITFGFGDQTEYVITSVDIKFDGVDGHGFTLLNNNGSENSNVRVHGGALAQQTGGSNWAPISDLDTDAWYNIEFVYLNGKQSGYNVYKYSTEGEKELIKVMSNCNRRNDKPYGKITFTTGLCIDNFKTTVVIPDNISITSPGEYMFTGEQKQFTATASRSGLSLDSTSGITWSVLDEGNLPIIDDKIAIDENGVLTVSAMASAQNVTVKAATAAGAVATAPMIIQVSEVFRITNVGVNEEGNKIVRLYVEKNFYYDDDAMFIVAIKSKDDVLKAVKLIKTFGDHLNMGSNEIATDFELPADFDPESDSIETMIWTSF